MRKIFLVCFGLVFLFVLSSCGTAGAVIRSNFEGIPVWYYIPDSQVKSGRSVFIGEGKAPSQRQAKLLAYSNLAENLGNYFGTELSDEYYRELTVFQTIEDVDLAVSDSYSFMEGGLYKVILRATANTELIEKSRSESALQKQKNLEEINGLVGEAVELMKEGLDFLAIEKYMDAMLLSYGNADVDSFYSFDELLKECLLILNSVSLNVSFANPSRASCRLEALVTEGKITSPAVSCPVLASFKALNVNGETYDDSFNYRTSDLGYIDFSPANYSIVRNGTVVFALDYEDRISVLESKVGKETVKELRKAFEEKKVRFDYELVYTDKVVGLVVMDFNSSGEEQNPSFSEKYFRRKFEESGIKTKVVDYNSLMDDLDMLDEYSANQDGNGYLFISRITEIDSFKSETGTFVVSCEGSFSIFDTKDKELLESSGIVFSTGFGKTEEEATEQSFENLADLFFSFVRSVYV